jgi:hypothetical protein
MKIYAYVTSETCVRTRAFEPGDEYQGQRVSRHGDLYPWTRGKRATLAAMDLDGAANQYTRRAARAVAEMKGWA